MKYLRLILLPFSWLYGSVLWFRRRAYEKGIFPSYQSSLPVISVGNLSLGGTGKTPMAEFLIHYFHSKNISTAYLSRGYGRKSKGTIQLSEEDAIHCRHGDEASQVMLKHPQKLVWVSEDRREGLKQIEQQGEAKVVVLDDAFQHLKVKRNLDVLMIDASFLPTDDHVLPAGNLREFRSTLKKADFLVINKVREVEDIPQIKESLGPYSLPMAFCQPVFQAPEDFLLRKIVYKDLRASQAILFSGIGKPALFKQMVEEKGVHVLKVLEFPDHYNYKERDIGKILKLQAEWRAETGKQVMVITTEKDRNRLYAFKDQSQFQDWFYYPIQLKWLEGKELFLKHLDSFLV